MRRLPVVATIRDAYLFTGTHLGGVIGFIWVPMVLATVMGFFSFQRYYNSFIDAMAGDNIAALGPSLMMMLGYLVAALLLQAIMYVAVVQLAAGSRSAPAVAYFAFGTLEWRMFRAFVAFIGLVLILVIPAFALCNSALMAASGRLPAAAGPVLLFVVLYGIILLAMPRFLALLPAIVVGETGPVLRRSWTLSTGNYWRLLAVLLAIFGPLFILFTVLEMVLAGRGPTLSGAPQVQLLAAIMRAREVLPLISGLGFLISPLVVALFSGASVSAWRFLKEEAALDIAA